MKKQLFLICAVLTISTAVFAQKEYKLAKTSGQLKLNIAGAIIEGYDGNEIVFSMPKGEDEEIDERAKGLRIISGSGYTDNTGIGLDVSEQGDVITVNSVAKDKSAIVTIKVPQSIKVFFNNTSSINQAEVILKNLKNEIEVSTSYNKIKLENNTGPMNIKTLYGSIDAIFSADIKGPVSMVSVYGYVDVSVPKATKANIQLSTSYGKLYAAEGLKISVEKGDTNKSEQGGNFNFSFNDSDTRVSGFTVNGSSIGHNSESIKGKINGGGSDFILKSNYKNVYLREK